MAIEIFTRKEQKYFITRRQYDELSFHLTERMRPDRYGINGCYTVTSLYFDNPDHLIYFETKNKLKFRQKLRLRVYDQVDFNDSAFFEIKQKHKKVVNKRRMVLPLREAYRYLEHGINDTLHDFESSNYQVFREIDYFLNFYQLKPEMVISYDRHALHGIEDADLRITFDFNLRCRNNDLFLENGPYGEHFIDENFVILEVKVNHSVPLWLTRLLQDLDCKQKSTSKFCTSIEQLKKEALPNGIEEEKVLIGGVY